MAVSRPPTSSAGLGLAEADVSVHTGATLSQTPAGRLLRVVGNISAEPQGGTRTEGQHLAPGHKCCQGWPHARANSEKSRERVPPGPSRPPGGCPGLAWPVGASQGALSPDTEDGGLSRQRPVCCPVHMPTRLLEAAGAGTPCAPWACHTASPPHGSLLNPEVPAILPPLSFVCWDPAASSASPVPTGMGS